MEFRKEKEKKLKSLPKHKKGPNLNLKFQKFNVKDKNLKKNSKNLGNLKVRFGTDSELELIKDDQQSRVNYFAY